MSTSDTVVVRGRTFKLETTTDGEATCEGCTAYKGNTFNLCGELPECGPRGIFVEVLEEVEA